MPGGGVPPLGPAPGRELLVKAGYPRATRTTTRRAPATHQAIVAFPAGGGPGGTTPFFPPVPEPAPGPPALPLPLPPFSGVGSGFPHAVQNLLPGNTAAPQEEHFSVFRGAPQEEQKFPDTSELQDGHFIAFDTPGH